MFYTIYLWNLYSLGGFFNCLQQNQGNAYILGMGFHAREEFDETAHFVRELFSSGIGPTV